MELSLLMKKEMVQYLRFIKPVSYTHLRAHETVLDLVCRLLLEKKNTTPIYNKNPIHAQHIHSNEHQMYKRYSR